MALGRRNLKNNWSTTLQADAAAAATTLSLPQPAIDLLTAPAPSSTDWYELTLDDGVQAPEIVRCTAKGTGTVTVVRAQQGTVAPTTWPTGTKCEIRITAELARVLEFSNVVSNSLFIGRDAGAAITTGGSNLGIGRTALTSITTGTRNVALGDYALASLTTTADNVAVGYQALNTTSGNEVTGVGRDAGMNAGTGSRSVFVGAYANSGVNLSDVIAIGAYAQAYTANTAVLGSGSSRMADVYIGAGQRYSQAYNADVTLHATCGSGTNIGGADLRLAGGSGTGTGIGGKVLIATAAAGASGSTENALTNRAEWDAAGLFWTYAGLKTGDPGLGAGTWKLGTVQAGAVALDTANYVEVDIGGSVVKLLKAA